MANTVSQLQQTFLPARRSYLSRLVKDLVKNRYVYIMLLPVVIFYLIFHYGPMYGVIISFKEFNPSAGILGSDWVGFKHFTDFFKSYYFGRLIRNTVLLNVYDVLFGFPAPIILALLLNEIRSNVFKRTIQTVTYMPHFISMVVVCGIIIDFLSSDGLINNLLGHFGIEPIPFLMSTDKFRGIYIISGIWQQVGWGSIIYLAALSGIDPQLYEAATIDGAGRWRKLWNVTIPGIMPTIIILLILRLGNMMNVGYEKIILLYNSQTYETADVISSFVYRKGLLEMNFSYSTAVGLFNSVINFTLLVLVNKFSRKVSDSSLW